MNIIELANESGLTYYGMGKDRARFIHHLEKFAALVEAAARADEREACANLCETMDSTSDYYGLRVELACADAIQARGTT